MTALSKILKKNREQRLGRFNRQLVIRLTKKNKQINNTIYHLVLARRRSKGGSRYDKLGYYEFTKVHNKTYNVLGLDLVKIKQALRMHASFHLSVYKILMK